MPKPARWKIGPVVLSLPFLLLAATELGFLTLFGKPTHAEIDVSKLKLPPADGKQMPLITPKKGEDGLYHHSWFQDSFLDLKDEWKEAKETGKKLVIFVEQRGCSYCEKIQKEILALNYINDYVRKNFNVVQLNLWGERIVKDFDGTEIPEKDAARRWGVLFTPTIIFYTDEKGDRDGKPASAWEIARMPGAFKKNTFFDMFTWVGSGAYKTIPNFQAFHINRIGARKALAKAKADDPMGDQKVNRKRKAAKAGH